MSIYNRLENHVILPGNFCIRTGYKLILKENDEETTLEFALFMDNDFVGLLISFLNHIDEPKIIQLCEVSYIFTFNNNLYESIGNGLFIHVLGNHSENSTNNFFYELEEENYDIFMDDEEEENKEEEKEEEKGEEKGEEEVEMQVE